MLTKLHITNYALIDNLEINFNDQLNIITGETGAGKSIIIGALGLILGKRADTSVLKKKEQKCIVEGCFNLNNKDLIHFFKDNDLDYDVSTLIRREINPNGKSRAFVNDTPVNLKQLQSLTELLIDIHSQHQTLLLNRPEFQANVVDSFSGLDSKLKKYRNVFYELKTIQKEFKILAEQETKSKQDQDYFQFQLNELKEAQLQKDELSVMEEELASLTHTEEIKKTLQNTGELINNEQGVLESLKQAVHFLGKSSEINPNLKGIEKRLESILIEAQDIGYELDSLNEKTIHDPQRIQYLTDRVSLINMLLQKHHKDSDNELILLKEELEKKLDFNSSVDEQLEILEKKILEKRKEAIQLAEGISEKRKSNSGKIEEKVKKLLSLLSMSDAELNIAIEKAKELNVNGIDNINFNFKTNKGGEFKPLDKVASGGELSRLMLAVKSVFADAKTLPTIIFDEIDTGVSGEVGNQIGVIMKAIAEEMQVITISHLPQIAGKGDAHYKVFKDNSGAVTSTMIRRLNQEERVEEIAKMLSGEKLTEAAMENARTLLN